MIMQVHNVTKNKIPFVHQGKHLRNVIEYLRKYTNMSCFPVFMFLADFCHVYLQVP